MAEEHPAPPAAEHPAEESHGGKEKKSSLEGIVNESLHGLSSAAKVAAGIGIPAAFGMSIPDWGRDVAILSGSQVLADSYKHRKRGEIYTSGNFMESSLVGIANTAILNPLFDTVNQIPTDSLLGYAAKGTAWGLAAYPLFVLGNQVASYVIRNRKLSGMGKYLKENYMPTLKKSWKYLLPFSLLNVFFAPAWLQIPIASALSLAYAYISTKKGDNVPEERKRDLTPYYVAAPRVLGKLVGNTFRGLYESVYAIGSGLRDSLQKLAPKGGAAPASAPAAAGEHH